LSLARYGYVTNYYYDEVGNLAIATTSTVQSTTYTHDSLNRLARTNYPDGTSETYTYDNNGNLIQKTDRNGKSTSSTYDSLNRLTVVTYPTNPTTQDHYTYDANGNLIQLQSQNATIAYGYDSRDRMTSENYNINPTTGGGGGGGSVAYGTLITMAGGGSVAVQNLQVGDQMLGYNTTTGKFTVATLISIKIVDTSNMLVINTEIGVPFRVDANPAQTLWVRTVDGSVGWVPVTQIQPGDSLFTVNGWVRVTSIEFAPAGSHVMFDINATAPYFADGYLDPLHKSPTSSTPTTGGVLGSTYTIYYSYKGEVLSSITYPDILVNYNYDGLGRVVNVTQSGSTTPYATFSYYKDNQVQNVTYGNGLTTKYSYDSMSRPLNITTYNGASKLLSLVYAYNKTGTVSSVNGLVNTAKVSEQYKYDPLRRLINSTLTNTISGSTTVTGLWYSYDSLGNRVSQGLNSTATGYKWTVTRYGYNRSNNELVNATSSTGTAKYGYDPNGNLLTSNLTSTTHWSYTWDVPGDLLRASNNSAAQGFYAYDGLGRRVESIEGSTTIFYAYQGTETMLELPSPGAITDYIYAGGLRIAKVSGTTVNYYHTDALGSTRLVTDSSKSVKVLFSDSYQPYGQDNGTPSGSESYKFTGKPVSQTTGLYYDYSRWYDPSIGRFISKDPSAGSLSDPQSQNGYVYARNLPTVLVDPTGAASCSDSLCQGPGVDYYNTANLPSDVSPQLRELCMDNPGFCRTFLRDAGYAFDDAGNAISPLSGDTGGGSGSTEPSSGSLGSSTPAPSDTGQVTIQVDPTSTTEPGTAGVTTTSTGGRFAVIGEDTPGRVKPFANQYGYEYFETSSPRSQWIKENAAWINSRMDNGYTIIDLGPAPGREFYPYVTSPYYAMEQALLAARNYARWLPIWGVLD